MLRKWSHRLLTCANSSSNSQKSLTRQSSFQQLTSLFQKLSFSTAASASSTSSTGLPSMMNPAAAAGSIQPMMLGGKQLNPMMPQYMQHHAAAGTTLPTAGASNTPQIATAVTNASQHPHHASLHHHQLSHHAHQQQYGTLSAAGGMGSSYASYTATGTGAYPQHYAAQFNRNFYTGRPIHEGGDSAAIAAQAGYDPNFQHHHAGHHHTGNAHHHSTHMTHHGNNHSHGTHSASYHSTANSSSTSAGNNNQGSSNSSHRSDSGNSSDSSSSSEPPKKKASNNKKRPAPSSSKSSKKDDDKKKKKSKSESSSSKSDKKSDKKKKEVKSKKAAKEKEKEKEKAKKAKEKEKEKEKKSKKQKEAAAKREAEKAKKEKEKEKAAKLKQREKEQKAKAKEKEKEQESKNKLLAQWEQYDKKMQQWNEAHEKAMPKIKAAAQKKVREAKFGDRPKYPKVPYFRFHLSRMNSVSAEEKAKGAGAIAALAKRIGEEWKALSEDDKKPFMEEYERERVEYRQKLEEWKANRVLPPRGATNAYSMFFAERAKDIKGVGVKELMPRIAKEFQELTAEQKEKYEALAKADRARCERELAAFKEQHPDRLDSLSLKAQMKKLEEEWKVKHPQPAKPVGRRPMTMTGDKKEKKEKKENEPEEQQTSHKKESSKRDRKGDSERESSSSKKRSSKKKAQSSDDSESSGSD